MRSTYPSAALVALYAALPFSFLSFSAHAQDVEAESGGWNLHWDSGLRLDSPNEMLRLRLNGRLSYDISRAHGAELEEASGLALADGHEWRQKRLSLNGWIAEDWTFQSMWSFPGNGSDGVLQTQTWLQWEGGPLDAMRVGHFREPFGLEAQTSLKYLQFAERSLATNVFSPGRSTGASVREGFVDGRVNISIGAFRVADEAFQDLGGETQVSARMTITPRLADDGREFMHAGVSLSRRTPDDDSVSFSGRPETHLGSRFIDTGALAADGVDQFAIEVAWNDGSLSAQGEWMLAKVDRLDAANNDFGGCYAQIGYFLTGEHQRFDRASGRYKRASLPDADRWNALKAGGAWQLVGRFSHVDLNDSGVQGGKQDNTSLGLNWYADRDLRVALNWIHVQPAAMEAGNVLLLRLQITF